jgi:hypothetical protein
MRSRVASKAPRAFEQGGLFSCQKVDEKLPKTRRRRDAKASLGMQSGA